MNLTSLLIRAKDRSPSVPIGLYLFHFVFVPSDRRTRLCVFFLSDFRSGIESDCREEDVNNSQNAHARTHARSGGGGGYVTRGAVRPVLSLSYKGTAWYAKRSLRSPLAAVVVCHRPRSSLSLSLSNRSLRPSRACHASLLRRLADFRHELILRSS